MGEPVAWDFFERKFTVAQRELIAYQLSHANLTLADIATLLGTSFSGAYHVLARAKESALIGFSPNAIATGLIDDLIHLRDDANWNRMKADQAADDELAAIFRRNATAAQAKAAELSIKTVESSNVQKLVQAWLRARSTEPINGEIPKPEAIARIDMLQWVYENRVIPRLKPPEPEPTDVEPIPIESADENS